jgi:hypothetical protein
MSISMGICIKEAPACLDPDKALRSPLSYLPQVGKVHTIFAAFLNFVQLKFCDGAHSKDGPEHTLHDICVLCYLQRIAFDSCSSALSSQTSEEERTPCR